MNYNEVIQQFEPEIEFIQKEILIQNLMFLAGEQSALNWLEVRARLFNRSIDIYHIARAVANHDTED